MTDNEFKALLSLRMCSDPWPLTKEDMRNVDEFLFRESHERGYNNWIEAYHDKVA